MIKVEFDLEEKLVIDVLKSALEGVCNYWYYIPEDLEGSTEDVIKAVLNGKCINVHSDKTEEFLGVLSRETIQQGITKAIKDGWGFTKDNPSRLTIDVWFQYIICNSYSFYR